MKTILRIGVPLIILAGMVPVAFAATNAASFGSLGERSSDMSTFGIAVCNNGTTTMTDPIPVTITANNVSVTDPSVSPIDAGSCAYTYFSYSSFNMIGGTQYTIVASSPDLTSAPYAVQVPGAVLGASIAIPQGSMNQQNRINLMAEEEALLKQLITLLKEALGQ